jgi:hypothetical protein
MVGRVDALIEILHQTHIFEFGNGISEVPK